MPSIWRARNNFTLTVKTARDWVALHDPGKELWLSEFNWSPFNEGTYTIQVRRMGQMCGQLKNWPVTRYSWFIAPSDDTYIWGVSSLFLQNSYTGALSDSGISYKTC